MDLNTLTVGQLIEVLNSYDKDSLVVLTLYNGNYRGSKYDSYTVGGATEGVVRENSMSPGGYTPERNDWDDFYESIDSIKVDQDEDDIDLDDDAYQEVVMITVN